MSETPPCIAVASSTDALQTAAQTLATRLQLPLVERSNTDYPLLLVYSPEHLALYQTDRRTSKPIVVDFLHSPLARRARGQQGKELLARAIKVKSIRHPNVIDVTAGFGRDAFLLSSLGCDVRLCERSPVIAALLQDGLNRLLRDQPQHRMRLISEDARHYLATLTPAEQPDVIYMDPMFSERTKSALVKKDMRILRQLVGDDTDAEALFLSALQCARHRVVVKRARLDPPITTLKPSLVFSGKTLRFDVFLI